MATKKSAHKALKDKVENLLKYLKVVVDADEHTPDRRDHQDISELIDVFLFEAKLSYAWTEELREGLYFFSLAFASEYLLVGNIELGAKKRAQVRIQLLDINDISSWRILTVEQVTRYQKTFLVRMADSWFGFSAGKKLFQREHGIKSRDIKKGSRLLIQGVLGNDDFALARRNPFAKVFLLR